MIKSTNLHKFVVFLCCVYSMYQSDIPYFAEHKRRHFKEFFNNFYVGLEPTDFTRNLYKNITLVPLT